MAEAPKDGNKGKQGQYGTDNLKTDLFNPVRKSLAILLDTLRRAFNLFAHRPPTRQKIKGHGFTPAQRIDPCKPKKKGAGDR